MKIYRYDDEGVFLREDEGYLDPEETKKQGKEIYMLPANSTFTAPPKTNNDEIAIFKNGIWRIEKDYRVQYSCNEELNIAIVDYIGSLKDGFILITKDEADKIQNDRLYYIVSDGKLVENPNYEADKKEVEEQRVKQLTVTKRVFALALQKLGITYTQLKELIATNEQAQLEWDLCVELERSNPLLDTMASQLSITPKQLDYIFKVANGEEV